MYLRGLAQTRANFESACAETKLRKWPAQISICPRRSSHLNHCIMSLPRPTTPTMRATRFVTPQNFDDDSSSTSGSPTKRRRSDVEDSDYSPRAEQQVKRAIAEKHTPGKRRKTGSSVATYVRENAVNAFQLATNFKFPQSGLSTLTYYHGEVPCLISRQQREVDCVETCHILPRAVRYDVVGFDLLDIICFHLTYRERSLTN